DTVSYDQLYDSLVQFEPHVQASKAKRASRNHDPLALITHSNASSSQSHASPSYSNSPQLYYVTHPSSVVDYEEDYQGELQGVSQEDKLTTVIMLLARAITQKFSTPTNNRLRMQEDKTRIKHLMQEIDQLRIMKVIRLFNVLHELSQIWERQIEQMLLAMKDEAGSNLNDEEIDFMLDNSFRDETLEELTAVVIMMTRIQPGDDNVVTELNYDAKAVNELAKKAFKEREDRYLEDIIDLEEKLSSHDRIVYKIGQSIQTIHMLGKTPNKVYDPFLKARLGYQNPKRLKKAIVAQPKMYHSAILQSTKLKINSPDSEETLEDAEESRLKMRNKMIQLDYGKLIALYETFVPQKDASIEQTYFSIPSTSNVCSESTELMSDFITPPL
ncbi:hypothetical protein Tco_0852861, partial [Tanacetum coccineum]